MKLIEFIKAHKLPVCIGIAALLCAAAFLILRKQEPTPDAPIREAASFSEAEEIITADFTKLEAEYTGQPYEGERFDTSRVRIWAEQADGTRIEIKHFEYDGADSYGGKTTYTLYTVYGELPLTIDPILIESVKAEDGTYYAGNEFSGNLVLMYQDGTTRTIRANEVTFPEGRILTGGVNAIPFVYEDCHHTLYVNATEGNALSDAKTVYQTELQGSIYNQVSDRMFMTVSRIGGSVPYYLTHVILSQPSQLHIGTANQTYGSSISASSAASSYRWIIGMNASAVTESSRQDPEIQASQKGCVIRNSQILIDGTTSGNEICLTSEGALFSPPAGVRASELLAEHVTDTVATTEPLLLQDGNGYNEGATASSGFTPVSAVGMVKPGEYYLVSTDAEGMSSADLQRIFASVGCTFARPLGKGMAQLYYKTTPICQSSNEALQDFIYFTE